MKAIRRLLIGILLLMFVGRAGVEVRRMVTEKSASFHPEIVVCGEKSSDQEGIIVWQFRNLGVVCDR